MKNDNFIKVKRILIVVLLANLSVALLKLLIGYFIKSAGLTADGFHSLTDGSSNIIGLIGIYYAAKPVDEEHPYGHKKYETLAGLFILAMLFVMAGRIIMTAIPALFRPVAPNISSESLIALIVTLGINVFISRFEYTQGKKLKSPILISDSMHTRSDVFISSGVLAALVGIKLGLPAIIDPVSSLVVSGFVLHAAYEIFSENCSVLMDSAAVDSREIKEVVMGFEMVRGVHKIRSRGMQDEVFIDLHILVEPDTNIERCHTLMHEIEEKLSLELKKPIHAVIHVEPYYDTW